MPSISRPGPPSTLYESPLPAFQTSEKYPAPWPNAISSSSAVERVTVARKSAAASPDSGPSQSANVRSSP